MADLLLPALVIDRPRLEAGTRPMLVNRDPGPDEIGAPRATMIRLEIIDPGDDGIDYGATEVYVDGVLAWEDDAAEPGFDGEGSGAESGADFYRIVLAPTEPFSSEQVVEVRVVARVVGGDPSLDETWSFTVEDYASPRLLSAAGRGQRVVRLVFDEQVEVTDPTGFVFVALGAPAVPIVAVDATADGSSVDVTVDVPMTPDVLYEVTASGVEDPTGNPVVAPDDVATFAGFRPARPAGRRFDLWSMLPLMNRRDDDLGTGDLRRFIGCLQEVVDLLLAEIDRFVDIFDPDRAPERFLDLLRADLGDPFDFELEEAAKRRLIGVLIELYRQKGTAAGIVNAVRFFLGIEVEVEHLRRVDLILGVSELGFDWELGSDERRVLYSFTVTSPIVLSEEQRNQVRAIAEFMKPAHTHLASLLEPEDPEAVDDWELGVSLLGAASDLH